MLSGRLQNLAILAAAILAIPAAAESAHAIDFSVHGYYRNRGVGTGDLDLQRTRSDLPWSNNRFGFISYDQMRLRLEPNLKLNDNLSIHSQFDILDNVLFGAHETRELHIIAPIVGQQTLPPGAGSFYMTGPSTVGENGAINIRRAWADILTPIGKFRIGRQPSHWGLGIFQNDGNEKQDDFGDTADRILYLIQYDVPDTGSITGGLLWDIAFEAQVDPRIDGLLAAPASNSRDTQQYGAMLIFDRPEVTAGVFGGLRRRNGPDNATTMTVRGPTCITYDVTNADCSIAAGIDGDTLLYFADLYARYTYENYKFQIEGVYVGGKITTGLALNAIPFAGLGAGEGIIQLPADQTARIFMAAFEAEAEYGFGGAWKFQTGFAQGDGSPLSQRVTQMGFRPDYQIALMMFHMPLGTSPALYGDRADGATGAYLAGSEPVTGNFINNAIYVSAGYKHKFDLEPSGFADWVKVGTKITTAFAHRQNTNINFADLIAERTATWPAVAETADSILKRWYGVEVDISGEAQLFSNLYTALEGGVLIPGREYDINVSLIDPGSIVEPIPNDSANLAWLVRLSAILEF